MRARIFGLLEGTIDTPAERWLRGSIQTLIVLNVAAVVIETVEPIGLRYATLFRRFEILSVALFTVEYLARLFACTLDPRYHSAVTGRLRFAVTPMALVDLLAILPAYLPMIGIDLRMMRVLRLMRIFASSRSAVTPGQFSGSLRHSETPPEKWESLCSLPR